MVVLLFASAALFFLLSKTESRFTGHQLAIAIRDIRSDAETVRRILAAGRNGSASPRFIVEETRAVLDNLTETLRDLEGADAEPSIQPKLAEILREIVSGGTPDSADARLSELARAL